MIAFSQCEDSTGDLLSGLDYDLFRRDPKIVLGPPGATTILNAIHARSGLVTYLGTDLVWGMGRKLAAPIRDNFIDTFFAGANASIHARRRWDHLEDDSIDNPGWHMLSSGEATGRILGGNLTSFVRLLELGMAPSHEASLLVLEDTLSELKDAAYIKQLLNTLEERGVFKEVKGVILGWFDGPSTLRDQVDATIRAFVADRCVPNGIPVLQITDLGHNVENFVFPIGSEATLNATSLEVVIMNNQT
jgi:muramoyltetrapeptide carboxypeptidase